MLCLMGNEKLSSLCEIDDDNYKIGELDVCMCLNLELVGESEGFLAIKIRFIMQIIISHHHQGIMIMS